MDSKYLPKVMLEAKRWFPVHVKLDHGKWQKKPAIEWSNPENWETYAEIKHAPALGFALGGGFFGIDMDGCLVGDGSVVPERKHLVDEVLEACPSFTEVSWSGKGLHVYGFAEKPRALKSSVAGLEMYSDKRFFLVTGRPWDVLDLKPLADIQKGVDALYARYGRPDGRECNSGSSRADYGEGSRSDAIFSRASVLYKLGYSTAAVTAAMLIWNREHCRPPKTDDEVRKQCENRYPDQRFEVEDTPEQTTEILAYSKVVEIAASNLREFIESKRHVSFGFKSIDRALGMLRAGSMTVIGGETGAGKSHLVHAIALNSAVDGNKPGIISIEDGVDEWGSRGIAILTGCTYQGAIEAKEHYEESASSFFTEMYKAPDLAKKYDIDIGFAISAKMETVMETAKIMLTERGRDFLLVDYAQAVRVDSDRARIDKAYADVAKRLKGLCAKYRVPLVLNSQLSRSKEDPTINSLKESGDLENEAEIVLLIWREKGVNHPRTLWRVGKAKWTGERPEGFIRFGTGGSINDLVEEKLDNQRNGFRKREE